MFGPVPAMLLVVVSSLIAASFCCDVGSFNGTKLNAYVSLQHIEVELEEHVTGCIRPSRALKDVFKVVVKNQHVPVLRPGAVEGLQQLQKLVLVNDGIAEVKKGAFKDLPAISTIDLSHNRIAEVEGVFSGMKVRKLLLNHNSISSIAPKAFDNMPNLHRLDLDNNELGEWNSWWFGSTPSLKVISASFNQIRQLPPRAFAALAGGKSSGISLSHNRIGSIDEEAFEGVKKLAYLQLDNNLVEDVRAFCRLRSVKHLVLNNNKVTCVKKNVLETLPKGEINLNGNPLNCQCVRAMKSWSNKSVNINVDIRSIECIQERIRIVMNLLQEN